MGQMSLEKNVGGIEGLCVITPAVHGDERGYFMEMVSERFYVQLLRLPHMEKLQYSAITSMIRNALV